MAQTVYKDEDDVLFGLGADNLNEPFTGENIFGYAKQNTSKKLSVLNNTGYFSQDKIQTEIVTKDLGVNYIRSLGSVSLD